MRSTMQDVPLSIAALLRRGSEVHANAEVITWSGDTPRRASYAQLGLRAAQLANALGTLGVRPRHHRRRVGQRHRHQPHRNLEDGARRRTSDGGARPRWIHHPDQFDRGTRRLPEPCSLHRSEARSDRPDADPCRRVGTAANSRELGPFDDRGHPHDPERADTVAVHGRETGSTRDEAEAALKALHALHIAWVDPVDVSNAVLWLASEEARFVTGAAIPIDGGATVPFKLLTANPESTPTSR